MKCLMDQLGKFSYLPNDQLPAMLDVVWCRWPHSNIVNPGPKPRPVLIRSLAWDRKNDRYAVEVAYGTSNMTKCYPNNLYVTQAADMMEAGLLCCTRFDLNLTKRLPWASEFFIPRPCDGKGPIVGRLSMASKQLLEEVKKRWR